MRPGDICYITGPSGAGKSVLLREMAASGTVATIESVWMKYRWKPINLSSTVLTDRLKTVVKTFNKVGMADVLAMLVPPALLSAGQQYRYRLAKAILSQRPVVFADEFMVLGRTHNRNEHLPPIAIHGEKDTKDIYLCRRP